MLHAALAQLGAHDTGQRADRRLVDVGDLERGGVQLVARAHTADDRRARGLRLHDQCDLAGHGVDGVNDVVVPGKVELVGGVGRVECLVNVDVAVGVDLQNAVPRDLDFVFCHGLARCQDLAVQVRQADLVIVDQVQCADAAAGQRIDGVAADTADAEHRHPGVEQPVHALLAEQ